MRAPIEFDGYPDTLKQLAPWGPYRAVCSRIVDGDTVYCLVDAGWNEYPYKVIRLRDYNAPELFTGDDKAAGLRSKQGLAMLMPVGTQIVLTDTRPDDTSFGRYVATILLADGTNVVDQLIAGGYGVRV